MRLRADTCAGLVQRNNAGAIGLVADDRWERFERRSARFTSNVDRLHRTLVRVEGGARIPAAQALRRPELSLEGMMSAGDVAIDTTPEDRLLDVTSVQTLLKYEGYLTRQEQAVTRAQGAERRRIPEGFPFDRVPGLSREMVQRFSETRPETLGQAQRIPGVTPAAVAVVGIVLLLHDFDGTRDRGTGTGDRDGRHRDLRTPIIEPIPSPFRPLA